MLVASYLVRAGFLGKGRSLPERTSLDAENNGHGCAGVE